MKTDVFFRSIEYTDGKFISTAVGRVFTARRNDLTFDNLFKRITII